jgi:hypothetical protein
MIVTHTKLFMTGQSRLEKSEDLAQATRENPDISGQAQGVASEGPQRVCWGIRYDRTESHTETENTTFQAAGIVKTADGTDVLTGLKESGVGAIFTGYTDTAFALTDDANQLRGQVRRTGLYLAKSGKAGSVQQVDIAV